MSSSHIQARSFSSDVSLSPSCAGSAIAAAWSAYWLFDLLAAVFANEYLTDELKLGHVPDFVAGVSVARVAPCTFLTHAKHGSMVCMGWRLVRGRSESGDEVIRRRTGI